MKTKLSFSIFFVAFLILLVLKMFGILPLPVWTIFIPLAIPFVAFVLFIVITLFFVGVHNATEEVFETNQEEEEEVSE